VQDGQPKQDTTDSCLPERHSQDGCPRKTRFAGIHPVPLTLLLTASTTLRSAGSSECNSR